MRKSILSFILLLWFIAPIVAQDKPYKKFGINNTEDNLPQGLKVGSDAPNFKLSDVDGNFHELSRDHNSKAVVLIFYRGNWCGQCNQYLSRIQDSLKYIKEAGAEIWAITPQTIENAEVMQNKKESTFPILSDVDDKVMMAYDVMFNVTKAYQNKVGIGKFTSISRHNGQEEARLPVPATFIIDKNQKIVFRHFDYDYSKRASVADILSALEKLSDM